MQAGDVRDGRRAEPQLFSEAEWRDLAHRFGLSDRECQLCRAICAGKPLKAAARQMGLSISTVRTYL